MARRMRETKKNRIPHGLGRTGSKAVNIASATQTELFQKDDKVPGQRSETSARVQSINALKHVSLPLMNYSPGLRA